MYFSVPKVCKLFFVYMAREYQGSSNVHCGLGTRCFQLQHPRSKHTYSCDWMVQNTTRVFEWDKNV